MDIASAQDTAKNLAREGSAAGPREVPVRWTLPPRGEPLQINRDQ
jgi:hypothetical protein